MTIKQGEIGRDLYISTGFDLSSNTGLKIKVTSPLGVEKEFTNPDVTAPATPSPSLPDLGILPASTYMLYATTGIDFDEDGDWTLCVEYTDATPKTFFGNDTTLTIGPAC